MNHSLKPIQEYVGAVLHLLITLDGLLSWPVSPCCCAPPCSTMPKAAAKEKAPKAAAKKGKAPAKSPAKAKKEKKEKDPNAPKRPLGAYFLFSNDMRAKVSPGVMTAALSG